MMQASIHATMPIECVHCHKITARKRGTVTLSGGRVQQIWHCRSCGRTFQTTAAGELVDPARGQRQEQETTAPTTGRADEVAKE